MSITSDWHNSFKRKKERGRENADINRERPLKFIKKIMAPKKGGKKAESKKTEAKK